MSLKQMMIYHCAPTMARLKIAALISIPTRYSSFMDEPVIRNFNKKYNQKGLYFQLLCSCKKRHLLYVYRKDLVNAYLQDADVAAFLWQYGYDAAASLAQKLDHLQERFVLDQSFPHELGIFLGYPLKDVKAFIVNKGNNALICGEWKAYSDVEGARRVFEKYTACRCDYLKRCHNGAAFSDLIVA